MNRFDDMEELQTIIKSLIEVGDRLDMPVLATEMSTIFELEEEIIRNYCPCLGYID